MVTLKQLFNVFGHDPKWAKLATASTQAMVAVYLRKLGDQDITTLTEFDIEMQYAMSDQPEDRKVKAKACMAHLLEWAKEQGKQVPTPVSHEVSVPSHEVSAVSNKKDRKWNSTRDTMQDVTLNQVLLPDESPVEGTGNEGCVYHDHSSKGIKCGRRYYHNRWIAEIMIGGVHFRHRSHDKDDCKAWLKAVRMGRINPLQNGADWQKAEQKRDLKKRYEEIIMSAAEEAVMVAEYTRTNDLTEINDYIQKRLLPHMMYYCAHSLCMGRKTSLDAAVQCVGILLQDIVSGKPVVNLTRQAKRMLRIRKAHHSFWYYENAPQDVKLFIDGLDLSPLEEVWKVTKSKRI